MQRRLRVALLTPGISDDAGIATPVIDTLLDSLAPLVDLELFTLRHPPARAPYQRGPVLVHPLGGPGMQYRRLVRNALGALRAAHRRNPFDLLHGLWLHEPATTAVLAGALLRRPVLASIGGAEVVALPEIGYGGLLHRSGRFVNRAALCRATLVSGGSRYVLQLARRAMPRRASGDFRLAPFGVDCTRFVPGPSRAYDPSAPRLFHAASLIPVKDQATLLRAFRQVVAELPAARLEIAGEDPFGHRAELERLAAELAIAEAVTFLGPLPQEALVARYQAADLFLLSSRHESQCMVVLEAAACGLPTVGTAVGVLPELAPTCALTVPVGNAAALAETALELLRDPLRLARLGTAAHECVTAFYAAEVAAQRWLALYQELAARRSRR